MAETWRAVSGFPSYEVSDLGLVRRRLASATRPGHFPVGRFLHPFPDKHGYLYVSLHDDGRQKKRPVHQLVWEAFRGPIPEGLEINHRGEDGNVANNRLSNLECVTHMENMVHARVVLKRAKGAANLPSERIVLLREKRAAGAKIRELVEEFGISQGTVCRLATGELHPELGGPRTRVYRIARHPPTS